MKLLNTAFAPVKMLFFKLKTGPWDLSSLATTCLRLEGVVGRRSQGPLLLFQLHLVVVCAVWNILDFKMLVR